MIQTNTSSLGNKLTPKKKVQQTASDATFSTTSPDGLVSWRVGVEVASPIANQPIRQGGIPEEANPPQTNPSNINPIDTSWMGNWIKKESNTTQPTNTTTQSTNTTTTQPTNTTIPQAPTSPAELVKLQNQVSYNSAQDYQTAWENLKKANDEAIAQAKLSADANIKAEESLARWKVGVSQQKILDNQLYLQDYIAEEERKKNEALKTLQPLQDTIQAKNQAQIESLEAKNTYDEEVLKNQLEAERSASNATLNKLGLAFSWSAVAISQNIAKNWLLKLAQFKSDNRYAVAKLRTEVETTELDYQLKINKIVSDSNTNVITKKKEISDKITDIQNNIILDEYQKSTKIEDLKKEYSKFKADTERRTFDDIKKANDNINAELDRIGVKLDKDKLDATNEIISLVKNWQWDKLSSSKKEELSRRSGKTIWEIEWEKTSAVYSAVNTALQAIVWKDFIISPTTSKMIYDTALAYVAMGDNINIAIQKAIEFNKTRIPELSESQTYEKAKRDVALKQGYANLASTQASTQSTLSNIWIAREKLKLETEKAVMDKNNPWAIVWWANEKWEVLMYNKQTWVTEYRKPELVKTPSEWKVTTWIDLLSAPNWIVIPSRLSETTNSNNWKECGEFANDLTWTRVSWQTIAEREKIFTQWWEPVIGWQVFFQWAWYDKTFGHVAVVTDINWDDVTIKESNLWWSGKIWERVVSKSEIWWVYNNTSIAKKAKEKWVTQSLYQLEAIGKPENIVARSIQWIDIGKLDSNEQKMLKNIASSWKEQWLSEKQISNQVISTVLNFWKLSPSEFIDASGWKWSNELEKLEVSSPEWNINRIWGGWESDKKLIRRLWETLGNASWNTFLKWVEELKSLTWWWKPFFKVFNPWDEINAETGDYIISIDNVDDNLNPTKISIKKMIKKDDSFWWWEDTIETIKTIVPRK